MKNKPENKPEKHCLSLSCPERRSLCCGEGGEAVIADEGTAYYECKGCRKEFIGGACNAGRPKIPPDFVNRMEGYDEKSFTKNTTVSNMPDANYMQIIGGHCYFCHITYGKEGHKCKGTNITACRSSCHPDAKKLNPITLENGSIQPDKQEKRKITSNELHREFFSRLEESIDKNFPKGECDERGGALMMFADASIIFKELIEKCRKLIDNK